jgi:hypothetical protein
MATVSEIMASGTPAMLANKLGSDPVTVFAAAGTTQATATLLTSSFANVTTVASSAGVRLRSAHGAGPTTILNNGLNVLSIYPATGEKINGLAANTAITVAPGKCVMLTGDNNQWAANISA